MFEPHAHLRQPTLQGARKRPARRRYLLFSFLLTLLLNPHPPALFAQASKKAAPAKAAPAPAKTAPRNSPETSRPAPAASSMRSVNTGGAHTIAGPGSGGAAGSHLAPRGASELHSSAGTAVMRSGGRGPSDVHDARRNMDIHHNLAGGRRLESLRPDGRRLVSERGRPGFIGHPYSVHGREFERRTYYDHGRAYDRFYRPYNYRGSNLRVYAPNRYYPAAYYGWAYRPWGTPVRYGWGFAGRPWYGAYGTYFQPYPVYASPSLWLTDFMLSQTLAAAYQAHLEAGADAASTPAAYTGAPISPEAKQMVASEIQGDIALENQEATLNGAQQVPDPASSGLVRLMSDGRPHAFIAGGEVDVVDEGGLECAVTDGDILQLSGAPAPQETTANALVLSSKGGKDCATGAHIAIGLDDLQEMQNHLREQVDAGLQEMAAKQGSGGLPAVPASALAAPTAAVVAEGAPAPDPAGAQELAQQDADSQQAEQEVLAAAGTPAPSTSPANGTEDLFKPQ